VIALQFFEGYAGGLRIRAHRRSGVVQFLG
jgi:hypothetical protein